MPCSSFQAEFPDSWRRLNDQFSEEYMHTLCRFLREAAGTVYPSEEDVFRAFCLTPFEKVKVVILGQDPYPNRVHAMGLAFSVPDEVRPHPLSLRNIYHELQTDLDITPARSGDLTRWAKQGVLLLNCALTVGAKKESHARYWKDFTNKAIELLIEHTKRLVFLLWGGEAKKKTARLVNSSRHHVLCAAHPVARNGFFGCRHFSQTNAFLQEQGLSPIQW